jgi:protein gp37
MKKVRYTMAKGSSIEWTDATWNVAVGCTKVDEDCKYCYMYRDSLRGTRYDPKQVRKTKSVFRFPLTFKETRSQVWTGSPLIFTSSLTDVFHPECDPFRDEMWDIIRKCPHLIFQILTKRPERIADHLPSDWGNGWDNVWLGTSVGHYRSLERVAWMSTFRAKVKFLSLEPLYGPIDLRWILRSRGKCNKCNGVGSILHSKGGDTCPECGYDYRNDMGKSPIDWVIVGGESGNENGPYRYRPCEFSWIEEIVQNCQRFGVPVFVKQMGTYLAKRHGLGDRHGKLMEHWPPNLQLREFPKTRNETTNG